MKQVVFLGTKSVGFECLKYLYYCQEKYDFNLSGVLTNNEKNKEILLFCQEKSLKVFKDLEDFTENGTCDIGISVQFHLILKKEHIDKARKLFVNLHMAPLPEYRGCNQFSFAIINGDKLFGTTIHELTVGIDSGDIIFEKRFQIPPNCWISELYDLTAKESLQLFQDSLPNLLRGDYILKNQSSFLDRSKSFHLRKEINEIKRLDLSWSHEKIARYVRATTMPGFEPPYFVIDGKKFFITIES